MEHIKNKTAALVQGNGIGYAAAMLSVVIETRDDEEVLARTLASLVSGAVEGVVREVIVCDGGSADGTRHVAEHAGCQLLGQGGLAAAVRRAKAEWLLLLEPGARLGEGWMEPVLAHAMRSTEPARFSPTPKPGLLGRLFTDRRPLAEGLVILKRQVLSLDRTSAADLARTVSATRLPASILPAERKSR